MTAPRVGIVDYRMGNLRSVEWALEHLGAAPVKVRGPAELADVDIALLPGVGHFGRGMQELAAMDLVQPLQDWAAAGRPLLGICLGFQLLFQSSEEGDAEGLGILAGRVTRLPDRTVDAGRLKVPHMGWNRISAAGAGNPLTAYDGRWFYFVHTYAAPASLDVPHATTVYGRTFAAAAVAGNVWGFQFHPERSGADGLALLAAALRAVVA